MDKKTQFSWTAKKIDYDLIEGKRELSATVLSHSDHHPLKPIVVKESKNVKASNLRYHKSDSGSTKSSSGKASSIRSMVTTDIPDPLSAISIALEDPLSAATHSQPAFPTVTQSSETLKSSEASAETTFHHSVKNLEILTKYSVNEALSNQMISVLKNGTKTSGRATYSLINAAERLQSRLNKLNDMDEGNVQEFKIRDQQQFIDKISQSGVNLKQAWEANQKVSALKTAIQCAKMLANMSVMQYYPSKFILITEVLESFGQMVFGRILSMCHGMSSDEINPEKVPENAREICSNWMLKISSIRELLPRVLIEASILPCYKFLKQDECNSVLVRLTNMAKGVGNPLTAIYVRMYLCMIGAKYAPKFRGHLVSNYFHFIATYKQINTMTVQNAILRQNLDTTTYLSLYTPALDCILSCIANNATENTLNDIFGKARDANSLLILKCMLGSFKPSFVSPRALEICAFIRDSSDQLFPKHLVFATLGASVVAFDPPEKHKQELLTEIWKYIIRLQDHDEYMECAVVWTEYVAKNFKKKEVNRVLGDILKHLTPDRAFEKHDRKILDIVKMLLTHMQDFSVLFSMEKFLPFLDMLQKQEFKLEVCKCLTDHFTATSDEATSDSLVINGMMYVCKGIHDAIDSMSLDSEIAFVSRATCSVVQRVTFGRDFEQQLNFYVDCRGSFHKLDSVLATLIHLVNNLSVKATKIMRHAHTAKTAAFVRACAAFCFITIPSLSNVYLRLQLYLVSGQASLISHCVAQADVMFCAAVTQIMDAPLARGYTNQKGTLNQSLIVSYVCNFLSTLLTVPDHPEQGMLYLLRGLLNVISEPITTGAIISEESRAILYIRVISLLTAYSQDRYIYSVDHVDSNENLYSSDGEFLDEISSIAATLFDKILTFLASASSNTTGKGAVAECLFSTIMAYGDLRSSEMRRLATTVWNLMIKTGCLEKHLLKKLLESIKRRGGVFEEFANRQGCDGDSRPPM